MSSFLDGLALSNEERAKLEAFGAATPFALLGIRKSAPEAFDAHIGPERAREIAAQLERLLTDDQRDLLAKPGGPPGALGARLPGNRD
ncbi:hypothetical protein [Paraburkholderia strydomiana]|uniref:hypothetical protein n=1 Tax=Paraburkholderia strydomiana TaxID=1245417 RepID=UPI0038B7C5ED